MQLCQAKGFVCEFCGNDKDIIFPFELNKCERCEGEPPLVVGGLSAARSSPTPSWKDWKFPVPRRLARVLSQDRREGEGGEEEEEKKEEAGHEEEEDSDEGGKGKTGSSLSLAKKVEVEEQLEEEREESGEEVEGGPETDEPKKETIAKLFKSFTPAKLMHAFSTEKKDSEKEMEGEGVMEREKEDGRIEGGRKKGAEKEKDKRNLLKKLASRGFSKSLPEQWDDKLMSKQGASAPDEATEREGDDEITVSGGLSEQSSDAKIDDALEGELETIVGKDPDAQGKPELKDETKSRSVKLFKPGKIFGLFTNIRRAEEKVEEVAQSACDVKEEKLEEREADAAVNWRSRKTRKARRVSKGRRRKERGGGGGGQVGEEEGRNESPVLVPSDFSQRDSE